MQTLLACLPHPPQWRYDWPRLNETALQPYFNRMAKVQQHSEFHGEGDVLAHTHLVCEVLAAMPDFRTLPEKQRQALALAALLHDVGKIPCTRMEDGRWTSPGHSAAGAQMARDILWTAFGLCGTQEAQHLRETVCLLIRWHMLPGHILEREDADRKLIELAVQGQLCPDFSLHLLCMLALADARGRIAPDVEELCERAALCAAAAEERGCLHAPAPFASPVTQHAYLSGRNVWPQQELYDDAWGEVILLCGLPGTGKDTWIHRNHPELPTVCMDDIRRRMGIAPTEDQGRVIQAALEAARVHLRAHEPFVWNATCISPLMRQKPLRLFEQYGARVRIVYLETGWPENLRRNKERPYAVPESVIVRMLQNLQPPQRHEAQAVEWLCL